MKTALDAPDALLDEHERKFVGIVREFGWHRMNVGGEGPHPAFTYTTGFELNLGVPELVIFSLKWEITGEVLSELAREFAAGRRLAAGVPIDDIFGNSAAYVFPVAPRHYPDHLGWSRWFYGGDAFACHQLVWPDRQGVFPWEPGFDEHFRADQPDLSETGWVNELKP